jgi:ribonuclease-3
LTLDSATQRLQRLIGYRFHDEDLLRLALTHRSASANHNERLEFLGDSVLGYLVSDILYGRHSRADEGRLTRMRAQLVKRETLAAAARKLVLGDYLVLGTGELRSGGQSRDSMLADALEALIAAVYLDGGLGAARDLILRLLAERLDNVEPSSERKDAKTRLQEYLQARQQSLPDYQVVNVFGEQHEQTFVVSCALPDLGRSIEGVGGSRRKAEQAAAESMLHSLGDA